MLIGIIILIATRFNMKFKGLLLALGTIAVLSCGAICFSHEYKEARADGTVDLEQLSFTVQESNTDKNGFYLVGPSNAMPASWDNKLRTSENDAILQNGNPVGTTSFALTKCGDTTYYFSLADGGLSQRTKEEVITLQGNWSGVVSGTTYTASIEKIMVLWTGSKWVTEYEYEAYDKVTLVNASYDDFDRVKISCEASPWQWNTFAVSEENTKNSFAFEFVFEAYGSMAKSGEKTFDIRIGSNSTWDNGHFYQLIMCNAWGPQGVIKLEEVNNDDGSIIRKSSGDINVNLQSGARHTIEFGSIYIKDSTDTLDYVKYDGTFKYRVKRTPMNDERTTKVGLSYTLDNIFVGSSMPQRKSTDTLVFNQSDGSRGIYFDGPVNDIPVDEWKVRGVPASKFNVVRNGEPLYKYGTGVFPLAKFSEESTFNYYISFVDFNLTFSEGDIVILGDEFHFYEGGKAYYISVKAVGFLYTNNAFTAIDDIYQYLYDDLANHNNPELYDDTGLGSIDSILSDALTALPAINNPKALWDEYKDFIAQLNAVPMDEEKVQALLEQYRAQAIETLNAYPDCELYIKDQIDIINNYLETALANIAVAETIAEINQIVEETKAAIDALPKKKEAIEAKILSRGDGFEEYLEAYDVVTTTDLCVLGEMNFYSKLEDKEADMRTYRGGGFDDYSTRIATNSENEHGNMVFQFNYSSTDPSSSQYGAQIYIRLRGRDDKTCYRFSIGRGVDDGIGVAATAWLNDSISPDGEVTYNAHFVAGETYRIECGAIDLKEYDRTYVYIKVGENYVVNMIVNSVTEDTEPTIRIFDSYTGEEGVVATLSAEENGTTKGANSSLLGRFVLDESSNDSSLMLSLRKNRIPEGTNLYPLQNTAFTINGEKVSSYRPTTYITKVTSNKYEVHMDYESLQDGDKVTLSGYFCSFDQVESIKTVWRLTQTEFTYSAATNTWSQDEASLGDSKDEAKEYLSNYVDSSLYSTANQQVIEGIIDACKDSIDAATTYEQVQQLLDSALERIDAVPTILAEYKSAAKEGLQSYKPANLFREEEQKELAKILEDAFKRIDDCTKESEVDVIVAEAKVAIDELKTAAQRDIEDLADAKRLGKAEIESYVGLLEMDRYSDENINAIQSLALKARKDVENATSIEEVERIINTFKEDIKNIQTIDGSIFDGEKYIEKNNNNNDWVLPVAIGGGVAAAGGIAAAVLLILKSKGILFVKK